jgi:hypothetical protein
MEHFAGLDVSVNETSVCIVDDTGKQWLREAARVQRCAGARRRLDCPRLIGADSPDITLKAKPLN